jgi:hypothetical protein
MCEDCEEIEPLTVAYYGKMDRRGWRPPATAMTAPINDDRSLTGRSYAIPTPQFVCEQEGVQSGPREVD